MNRLCILDSRNNTCINILFLNDENEWVDHAYFVKAPRNDGEIGWILQDGEWINTIQQLYTLEERMLRIRGRRDKLLTVSDKYMLVDYPITESKRQEWSEYRQQLRDLPNQSGFPDNVEWPTPPT